MNNHWVEPCPAPSNWPNFSQGWYIRCVQRGPKQSISVAIFLLMGCLGLSGCGRIGYHALFANVNSDSGLDGSQNTDGSTDNPPNRPRLCTNWSAFGAPTPVAELNGGNLHEFASWFSADGLRLYLTTSRGDLGAMTNAPFTTTRSDVASPWAALSAQSRIVEFDSAQSEFDLSVSTNALEAYFSRQIGAFFQVIHASRASSTDSWGNIAADPALNPVGSTSNADGVISYDGKEIYVTAIRSGGAGGQDVWMHRRASSTDPWDAGTILSSPVNTNADDWVNSISSDGLELFGYRGSTGSDVWRAWRSTPGDPWTGFELLPAGPNTINASTTEYSAIISPDGTTLYFSTDRTVADDFDIWQAKRTCFD